jgi:hypothetical protein
MLALEEVAEVVGYAKRRNELTTGASSLSRDEHADEQANPKRATPMLW